jgi:uncharacterized protein (TIGR02147 family)
MPNIYGYFDHVAYLRDDFAERQEKNLHYSLRAMADKLGLNSSTIVRVMHGKRNVSKRLVPVFIDYLGLRHKEADYFKSLVAFNQAKSGNKRVDAYRSLVALRNGRTKNVANDQCAFYEHWYVSAIRELLRFYPFQGNYNQLAKMLSPPITVNEARGAIKLLRKLGFIDKVGNAYAVQHSNISTGECWHAAAIHHFQQQTLLKASEALDRIPKKERDFSTMTMCYSDEGFKKIRDLLKRTREELVRIEESDKYKNVDTKSSDGVWNDGLIVNLHLQQ